MECVAAQYPNVKFKDKFLPSPREVTYPPAMLTEYIQAALREAHYELMEAPEF